MIKFSILLLLLILVGPIKGFNQEFNRTNIEKTTQSAIARGYAATVKIWGIDSVTKKQNSSQFSGVVVSTEGHILTAAHAIITGNKFKVLFPDGKEYIGLALGRMGIKSLDNMPDLGMIRIIGKGEWPVAEMGWSYSLKVNEPCISIAYPDALAQAFPTIRYGRITNPATRWGFVESTCKMEPGDSGGPLFDYLGRVIAIHSRIDLAEDVNYEVPIDLYRKHWSALIAAQDYKEIPQPADPVGIDPKESSIIAIPELAQLKNQFTDFEKGAKENSLMIKSALKGKEQKVLGTLLLIKGKKLTTKLKSRSFVVSKSSLVGDSISVFIGKQQVEAFVISRFKDNDLVLLQLKNEVKSGINLADLHDTTSIKPNVVGKFLISIIPDRQNEISALSSGYFDLPKKLSSGFFGANANFINQQIILTNINPTSPAAKAGLQLKDQITGINNVSISLPPQYGAELMKHEAGEVITIQGIRNGVPYNLPVTLTAYPPRTGHPAYRFDGGKSVRLDGFKNVFAHDAIIKPDQCGSPVFDADGKFCGINIARYSRTTCLAISSKQIYEFVNNAIL